MRVSVAIGCMALMLAGSAASAQTAVQSTTSQTTTVPAPVAVAPPPVGTLSTTRETHAQDAYGNETTSKTTSYRDSQGVAEDRQTTTRIVAPPPPVATTTTTTTETTTAPQ